MPFVHPVNPQSVVAKYMRKAKAEGKAEGIVEGKAEGKVEGKAEMRREIAAAMLEKGMDWATIAGITGVTETEMGATLATT
jgi:predicted transposase/invertase (TIGR01784 family)